jgi:transposase
MQQRQIIAEIETGNLTTLEALKKYKISESTFYYWKKKYSNEIVSVKATDNMEKNQESNASNTESKHLEELKLKIIALETMIDIAEKEFNIPIRKKCGSKQ